MLRHDLENHNAGPEESGFSRRSFFSRFALGAALSVVIPGVAHATKSAEIKADKKNRLAQSPKSNVRLPKQLPQQGRQTVSHERSNQAIDRKAKGFADRASTSKATLHQPHKNPELKRSNTTQVAHHAEQHSTRIRDRYPQQRQIITSSGSNHSQHLAGSNRLHSVIQPNHKDSIFESTNTPLFIADHGRIHSHRSLTVQNPHTGDKLSLTYFEQGRYLSDALSEISFLLRDYRTGDVHPIDPELLDQLHDLKQMLGIYQPFDVICGYRSPITNARLHAEHSGVANNSYHMHGRAVDIRVERFDLRRIHNAALAMHRGGVGYYPESNFIHLDTGTFRTWTF